MGNGGFAGGHDALLADALRRLAWDAPSDEGLLAGVHAASARAAVRRRALAASVAVIAVVGVATAVSATGSTSPTGSELVLGAPDETPSSEPTADASPAPDGSAAAGSEVSDTYRGRAVSPAGKPVEGLYVYVIPGLRSYWFRTEPVTRTAVDGTFELPCPKGRVLLNAFLLGKPQDGSTPNWRTTYVGGGYLLLDAQPPSCTRERQDTTVPEGAVLYGSLRARAGCLNGEWAVGAASDGLPAGHIGYDQDWLRTIVAPGGAYRLAGLPPGTYGMWASPEDEDLRGTGRAGYGPDTTLPGPGRFEVSLDVPDATCADPTPPSDVSPPDDPGASASPEPEVAPTPEPEVP
jgi:hypothetical protein